MKCELCLLNEASRVCRICGRHVCVDDYVEDKGICIACRDTLCYICGERLAVSLCARCGKPVCRLHSIRVGLVRYCVNCARELGILHQPGN